MNQLSERKQQFFEALLPQGIVYLQIDARRPGVEVPEKFKQNHILVLKFSLNFGAAIKVDPDECVRATLSFGAESFACVIPWSAIYGMHLDSGAVKIFMASVPWDIDQWNLLMTEMTPMEKESEAKEEPSMTSYVSPFKVLDGGKIN